jgi:LAS superfamily LD-carboxypeptidase LdcB
MSSLDDLEPWLVPYAKYLVSLGGAAIQVTSVYRSTAEQTRLYRRYLAGQSKYPAAPPGSSWHEYRRAWDMIGPPDLLEALGRTWQSWGGTWGGAFSHEDPIHFQA